MNDRINNLLRIVDLQRSSNDLVISELEDRLKNLKNRKKTMSRLEKYTYIDLQAIDQKISDLEIRISELSNNWDRLVLSFLLFILNKAWQITEVYSIIRYWTYRGMKNVY